MRRISRAFSLVGPGRVGSSLAQALCEAGWQCRTIVGRRMPATELTTLKKAFPVSSIDNSITALQNDFSVLFVTVQDDNISDIVEQLLKLSAINWRGRSVLLASGVVDVNVLSGLRKRGALAGALHPIAAFANKLNPETPRNTCYDFFGDSGAVATARRISRQLNSKLLILKSEKERTLLHVASAFASNSTVIAVRSAERLITPFVKAANAKYLMENLLRSTLRNLSDGTNMESLTGPLKRGDVNAVLKHLSALESEPRLLQFYKSWSLLGVEELLEVERDSLRRARLKQIRKILSQRDP